MGNQGQDAVTNRLLLALPSRDRTRILAQCESVDLKLAEVLSLPGERMRYAYFPTDSFISFIAQIDGKARLEVGMAGNEGMFGVALFLGVEFSPIHALVQGAGKALRMSASQFRLVVDSSPNLRERLNRYVYTTMSQLVQTAACTHFHLIDARLARWLLMSHDRARSDSFYLTQEFLSHMLGVRRVGVSAAASGLRKRKVITYSRGLITILDRSALEAESCACYAIDQKSYERVMA